MEGSMMICGKVIYQKERSVTLVREQVYSRFARHGSEPDVYQKAIYSL